MANTELESLYDELDGEVMRPCDDALEAIEDFDERLETMIRAHPRAAELLPLHVAKVAARRAKLREQLQGVQKAYSAKMKELGLAEDPNWMKQVLTQLQEDMEAARS